MDGHVLTLFLVSYVRRHIFNGLYMYYARDSEGTKIEIGIRSFLYCLSATALCPRPPAPSRQRTTRGSGLAIFASELRGVQENAYQRARRTTHLRAFQGQQGRSVADVMVAENVCPAFV